jgi:hypothetical protein
MRSESLRSNGATLTLTAQYRPGGDVDLIGMHGVTPREVALYDLE